MSRPFTPILTVDSYINGQIVKTDARGRILDAQGRPINYQLPPRKQLTDKERLERYIAHRNQSMI